MKLLIVLLAVVSLAHGEMRRIWEVQLSKKIKEPAGWPQMKYHALQSLAFSPDSKWLAVTIDDHQTTTTIGTHVLVVDLSAPPGSMKQYDVDACGAPIEWAPDGHAILVCTLAVVNLKSGETCTAIEPPPANLRPPLMRGALSSARWLDSRRILRNSANGVSVLDEDCAMQPTGRDDMTAAGDETRKIPPGWPPVELKEYKMINASRTPPRVLADRWSDSLPAHFDIEPAPTVRRRVVWDLSDKREIASWKPHEGRPYNQLFYVHPYQDCTLSPDGHLVAEGGNGVVRLYRLD